MKRELLSELSFVFHHIYPLYLRQSSISPIGRELIKVLDNATQAYGHVGKIVQLKSFEPLMNLLDTRARYHYSCFFSFLL